MGGSELEARAEQALSKGEIEEALDAYQQLELQYESEPSWSRIVAGLHQTLGDEKRSREALVRAADRCVARREPIKAIAACKLIQAIDPFDDHAMALLDQLLGRRAPSGPLVPADLEVPPIEPGSAPAVVPLLRRAPKRLDSNAALHLLDSGGPVITGVPLFAALERPTLLRMLKEAKLQRLPQGEQLFRQGDKTNQLYVIVEGSVSLYLEPEGGDRIHLADLDEGSFFGEIALFTDRPRGATAVMKTSAELLEISREAVLGAIQDQPSAVAVLLSFLRERLVAVVLGSSPFFRQFDEIERRTLFEKFALIDVDQSAVLIRQGSASRGIYVLVDGSLAVTRETDAGEKPIATLSPGQMFGEISTLTRLPAIATVKAQTTSLVLELSAHRIEEAIAAHPRLLTYATELATERMTEMEALLGHGEQIHLL